MVQDKVLAEHYIKKYDLQKNCSMDLASVATLVQFDANEMICAAGELSNVFYILVEGDCMAYDLTQGNKIHCECLYRGVTFMGFVSVLWNKPVVNDILAVTPCTLLALPADQCREVLLHDITFLQFALHSMADHFRRNSGHFEPLPNRLASMILNMSEENLFHYNLTICADLLDISYRHLLRSLNEFCQEGLLTKVKKGYYQITDRNRLIALSDYNS